MNMSKKSKRVVRSCDICGKTEFEHLKPKDFFQSTPALIFKNYEGEEIKISLQLQIDKCQNKSKTSDKLNDIMQSYMDDTQQRDTIITPFGPMPAPFFGETNDVNTDAPVICKICFRGMINMLTKFGKFDKVEVF